jgi:hypothetical protein
MTPVLLTIVLDAYKRINSEPLVSPEPLSIPLIVSTEFAKVDPPEVRPVLICAVPVNARIEPAAMVGVDPEIYKRVVLANVPLPEIMAAAPVESMPPVLLLVNVPLLVMFPVTINTFPPVSDKVAPESMIIEAAV